MTVNQMSTESLAEILRETNRRYAMSSERSQQQAEHRIGASEIGLCRQYLKYMIEGTEYTMDDAERDNFAAFAGSAMGDRIEAAYQHLNPTALTQVEFEAEIGGRIIPCHADIVDVEDDFLVDVKTKSGLGLIQREGPSHQNEVQVRIYRRGLIQQGLLTENSRAFLAYYDRGGDEETPVVYEVDCSDEWYAEIDEWIRDAEYAVMHKEDAPRDQYYDFCISYCPFVGTCRSGYRIAEGVNLDPEVNAAAELYEDAKARAKKGEQDKDTAKKVLFGQSGYLPDSGLELGWTEIPATDSRRGYMRMSLRPVGKKKTPPAPPYWAEPGGELGDDMAYAEEQEERMIAEQERFEARMADEDYSGHEDWMTTRDEIMDDAADRGEGAVER